MVAIGPPNPLGYYKDEEKTARTFRTIDGVRYSIPGDWCMVEADGSLTLLGRGNACINTAGEKVFPEEVEEALKTHPVGRGRPGGRPAGREVGPGGHRRGARWPRAASLDEAALRAHVRKSLAGYKTPKRIVVADRAAARRQRQGRLPGRQGGGRDRAGGRGGLTAPASTTTVSSRRPAQRSHPGSPSPSPAKQIPDSSLRSLPG